MKSLHDIAVSKDIADKDRKGILQVAQQFERYKKEYEKVKLEKDELEAEQLKIFKHIEKADKESSKRK